MAGAPETPYAKLPQEIIQEMSGRSREAMEGAT